MFQALIGATLAILSVAGLQAAIMPRLGEALPFLQVNMTGQSTLQIALVLILAGVFIGLVGSGFALRRYLKV